MIIVNSVTGDRPPAEVVTTDNVHDASNLVTYTFSGVSIGTAAASRRVVVATHGLSTASLGTVTVGGVSATRFYHETTTGIGLWIADVTTGTTATVVVTNGGGLTAGHCSIGVFALYWLRGTTPTDTEYMDGARGSPQSINVDARGVALGFAVATTDISWTGLAEDSQVTGSGLFMSAASVESGTTQSLSVGCTGTSRVAAMASFR